MKSRLIAVATLVLLAGSVANAGVLRFAAKHLVKPAATQSGRVLKPAARVGAKAVKAVFKVAI